MDDVLVPGWWNARTRTEFCNEFGIEPNKANQEKIRCAINEAEENNEYVVGSCGNGYFIIDRPEGVIMTAIFKQNRLTGCSKALEDFIKRTDQRTEFDVYQLMDGLLEDQSTEFRPPDESNLDDFRDR